jgi:hypothetical protein
MKKLLTVATVLALSACLAGNALAAIGWANIQWPTNGTVVAPTGPVTVYTQVWKGGSTDLPGPAVDITGVLKYTTNIAPQASVPLTFNVDAGSNDENKGDIPQAALVGASYVDLEVVYTDVTDATTYSVSGVRYTVTNVLPNAVDVKFTLCMSGTPTNGAPCVIGSVPQIGTWGTGVNMTNVSGDLYTVTITWPAGSNPYFEYKFKSDGCSNWEGVGNRVVTLPTDGTTTVNLATDSFNNAPLGCNLGQTLSAAKTVCFQVCLSGQTTNGAPCVIGNVPELGAWGTGVNMTLVGADLYQACITFPAGTPIPQNLEYKFKKDGCGTWESVGNRTLTVDNSSPSEQTLTSTWDNGTAVCAPVAVEPASWSSVKASYR